MRINKIISILLIMILFIISSVNAAIVSDDDGSAFVTKGEFDALKNSFNKQIDNYNASIDGKIDGAIASYLSGLSIAKVSTERLICSSQDSVTSLLLEKPSGSTDTLIEYIYGRCGFTGNDRVLYENLPYSANQYKKLASVTVTVNPQHIQKILVRGLDKVAKKAIWDGFTQNATENWDTQYCWWSNAGSTSSGAKIAPIGSTKYLGAVRARGALNTNTQIARYAVLYDTGLGDVSGNRLSDGLLYRDAVLDYGDVFYKSAFVWQNIAENRFITDDEILGFGNTYARGKDASGAYYKAQVGDQMEHINATIQYQLNGETTYIQEVTDEDITNVDDYQTVAHSSCSVNVFYGEAWADDYLTNWKQLQTDFYGKNYNSPEDYLYLYQGIPFIEVKKNQVVEYDMQFSDTNNYTLIASFGPFKEDNSSNVGRVKISVDGAEYVDEATIMGGAGKIKLDFKDTNVFTGNPRTIFLKWKREDTGYNGGGTLLLNTDDRKNARVETFD